MIERTATVKSAEWVDGSKGQYLSAVLVQGDKESKQAIFDEAAQEAIAQAKEQGVPVIVQLEKKDKYWNVIGARVQSPSESSTTPVSATTGAKTGGLNRDDAIIMQVAAKIVSEQCQYLVQASPAEKTAKEVIPLIVDLTRVLTVQLISLRDSITVEKND